MTPMWPTGQTFYAVAASAKQERRAGPFTTRQEAVDRARALGFGNDSNAWIEHKGKIERVTT